MRLEYIKMIYNNDILTLLIGLLIGFQIGFEIMFLTFLCTCQHHTSCLTMGSSRTSFGLAKKPNCSFIGSHIIRKPARWMRGSIESHHMNSWTNSLRIIVSLLKHNCMPWHQCIVPTRQTKAMTDVSAAHWPHWIHRTVLLYLKKTSRGHNQTQWSTFIIQPSSLVVWEPECLVLWCLFEVSLSQSTTHTCASRILHLRLMADPTLSWHGNCQATGSNVV